MPQMADITVKKADGTTNVTYSALTPSAGDNVAAQWRSETAGAAAGLRPTMSMKSGFNGPRTARQINQQVVYPETVTDSVTGVARVRNRVIVTISATYPLEVPSTVVDEAVAQSFNLFGSTLSIASHKSGYAPT